MTLPSGYVWGHQDRKHIYDAIKESQTLSVGDFLSLVGQGANPEFVIPAVCAIRITGSYVLNDPIGLSALSDSEHFGALVTSVTGTIGQITVNYPAMKRVSKGWLGLDETLGPKGYVTGPSVGLSSSVFKVSRTRPLQLRMYGDGAGNWTLYGQDAGKFSVSTFNTSTGLTTITITDLEGQTNYKYTGGFIYQGPQHYGIQQKYSGLGASSLGFYLIDTSKAIVVSAPSSDDNIIGINMGEITDSPRFDVWKPENQYMAGGTANFWYEGMMEAYMVARGLSTTEILVKWQEYTSATNYKIYRDTDPAFGTQVKIYDGTELQYLDSGLSSGTLYYYKLVAEIASVDTDITTFNAATK